MLPQNYCSWFNLYEPPACSPTYMEPSHYEPPTRNNQLELANMNLPLVF